MHPLLISYPKSGRTWLRFMLDQLGVRLQYDHMGTGSARQDWGRHCADLRFDADISHPKVVLLIRDPRDVVVSFFHQMTKRERLEPMEKLRLLMTGRLPPRRLHRFVVHPRFGLERVIRYNLNWTQRLSNDERAALAIYEDFRSAPAAHLRALLDFIGERDISDEEISAAIESGAFDRMKAREQSGEFREKYRSMLSPRNSSDPDSYKVRRGRIGGYRSEMEPTTIQYCDELLRASDYFGKIEAAASAFKEAKRLA
jgi:hypothetical protein